MKKIFLLALFSISIFHSSFSQVANDECTGALTLTPSSTCTPTSGTLTGAGTSTLTTACNGYADVFYKFVASSAAVDVTVVPSSTLDAKLSILSACGTSASLVCQDNGGQGGTEKAKVSTLTVGQTYYIKVSSYNSTLSTPTFTICVQNTTRPANDECSAAVTLTPATTPAPFSGTLAGSTRTTVTTSCSGDLDVFYKFVATSTSAVVAVTPSASFNPFVSLFTSCAGSYLACVDNSGTGSVESMYLTNLTLGSTYYLKVASNEPATGIVPAFTIAVQNQTPVAAPANDECAGATTITASTTCTSINATIAGATTSTATSSCVGYNDVFFKFVATSASADITVTPSAGLNPAVSLFSACGGTALYCGNDNYTGYAETIQSNGLVPGNTYYIKVSSYDFAPYSSTFSVCVKSVTRPVNDECTGAISLTPSTTCSPVSGTLADASTTTTTTSCGGNYDVFYKFTATSPAVKITVTPTLSTLDLVVGVFSGCGTSSLDCKDNTASNDVEVVDMDGLIIGNTYYIKVQAYSSTVAASTFTICVQNQVSQAPANDECTGAIALTPNTACSSVAGTIYKATTSAVTTGCGGYYDVFYKFVANAPTATVNATGSSEIDMKLSVFSACGGTSLACVDNTYSGETETAQLTGLTAGTTYYIKVSAFSTSPPTSTSTFTVCVISTPATVPVNDECSGAITLTPSTSCNPVTGTSLNATKSTITASSCQTGNSDVFYKFVATSTNAVVTVVGSSGYDAVVSAHSTCGGAYTTCIDNTSNGSTEVLVMTGLTIGNTYYIKVQQYGSSLPATPTFTICVTIPPANDECANAVTLTQSSTCINTTGIFNGATTSAVANGCSGNLDVYYKFVANATTATITADPGADVDVILSVMASCTSTTSLACVDDMISSTTTEVANVTGLTVGGTYYVKIQNYIQEVPANAAFTVCVKNTVATGLSETNALKSITMFPNPAQGMVHIENVSEVTQIEFMDVTGTPVFVKEITGNSSLDVSSLSAGVYIVKLTMNGVTENRRLVVSK